MVQNYHSTLRTIPEEHISYLHHGRSLKLVTAHVLLTTETHFKNSKLWCGCILFISSSRYYHRYIFNMLHAMFYAYILLYTQIFHCTFQHSMHPICSRVSAFTHMFQIQILSCWNFLNPSRCVTSCFMLVSICMLPKWLQTWLLHVFKCKLTKQELSYISHYYSACGEALYMCMVLKQAWTPHPILIFHKFYMWTAKNIDQWLTKSSSFVEIKCLLW